MAPHAPSSLPPEGARPGSGAAAPGRLTTRSLQHAPRQRHAQQLVERVVDRRAPCTKATGSDEREAHAQHPHQRGEVDEGGEQEAEPVDDEQVEDVARDQHGEGEHVRRRAQPLRRHRPRQRAAAPRRRARRPPAIRSAPQTRSAAATRPGKSAGPTFCPGMRGKPWTCQRIAAPSSASSAPQTVSSSFMRAQVAVGLTRDPSLVQDDFAARREVTWRCRPPSSSRRGRRPTSP